MSLANRVSKILESTTTDDWFYVSGGDNQADTGTRGKTAEALKESGWVEGPLFLKTNDWPFKPDSEFFTSIRLKRLSYDSNEDFEKAANFWKGLSSFPKLQNTPHSYLGYYVITVKIATLDRLPSYLN